MRGACERERLAIICYNGRAWGRRVSGAAHLLIASKVERLVDVRDVGLARHVAPGRRQVHLDRVQGSGHIYEPHNLRTRAWVLLEPGNCSGLAAGRRPFTAGLGLEV